MFHKYFQSCYLKHLETAYSLYYDDLSEYGNPLTATEVFYYIAGIDGVPGQIRFALPSLLRRFGRNIYVKCLYLDEYAADKPIWEKYTIENCNRRKQVIIQDILMLATQHQHINILAFSNGFYDFIHASSELFSVLPQLNLYWAACSPDHFLPDNSFEKIYAINGFKCGEYRWAAFPLNNWLTWLNPEMAVTHRWKRGGQHRVFHIDDVVTRFLCLKFYWFYISLDAFNACLKWSLRNFREPIQIRSCVLAAENDGFWCGPSRNNMEKTIAKYLTNTKVLKKPNSHSWVAEPNNMDEFLNLLN